MKGLIEYAPGRFACEGDRKRIDGHTWIFESGAWECETGELLNMPDRPD